MEGFSDGFLPQKSAQRQACETAQPQIAPTYREAHIQPGVAGGQQENQIAQVGQPRPQGPQKAVEQPQQRTDGTGCEKPPGSQGRSGHPNRRRKAPPFLLCS